MPDLSALKVAQIGGQLVDEEVIQKRAQVLCLQDHRKVDVVRWFALEERRKPEARIQPQLRLLGGPDKHTPSKNTPRTFSPLSIHVLGLYCLQLLHRHPPSLPNTSH